MAPSLARVCLGTFLVCLVLTLAECRGRLEVRMIRYYNRYGQDSSYDHCDSTWFGKSSDCDLRFKFTLDTHGAGRWQFTSKTYYDQNSVSFSSYFSNYHRNPIKKSFNTWRGRLTVKAYVVDMDSWTGHDHVDTVQNTARVNPDGRTRYYAARGHIHRGNSYLYYSVKVSCDSYFHTSTCGKYCRPQDSDAHGHYTCTSSGNKQCRPGWMNVANSCKDRDRCHGVSCLNGGRCESGRCHCPPTHHGSRCEARKTPCQMKDLCRNGATCVNVGTTGSTCACKPGWEGRYCQEDVNECSLAVCKNGATCTNLAPGYSCRCARGFTGANCTQNINECTGSAPVCRNGGTCVDSHGSYSCRCTKGYKGRLCETDIDECAVSKPCKNNGTCSNTVGGYKCTCAPGFRGRHCEIEVNECALNSTLCRNNGTCENTPGGFRCACPVGFEGRHCERDVDECVNEKFCLNDGLCINSFGSVSCNCTSGYHGVHCQLDVDECAKPDVCRHNGTCTNTVGGYSCVCASGFSGANCEVDVDECSHNRSLCANNGTCLNVWGGHSCVCANGFMGPSCEKDVDECLLDGFCQNNATCTNTFGGAECSCPPGFSGMHCETNVNECEAEPDFCRNGGICEDTVGSARCRCPAHFSGPRCADDVDECATLPQNATCRARGRCVNELGSFRCSCRDPYVGQQCEGCDPTARDGHLCPGGVKAAPQTATSSVTKIAVPVAVLLLLLVVLAVALYTQRRRLEPYVDTIRRARSKSTQSTSMFFKNGGSQAVDNFGNPIYGDARDSGVVMSGPGGEFDNSAYSADGDETTRTGQCDGQFSNALYASAAGRTARHSVYSGPAQDQARAAVEPAGDVYETLPPQGEQSAADATGQDIEEETDEEDGYARLPAPSPLRSKEPREGTAGPPPPLPPRDITLSLSDTLEPPGNQPGSSASFA